MEVIYKVVPMDGQKYVDLPGVPLAREGGMTPMLSSTTGHPHGADKGAASCAVGSWDAGPASRASNFGRGQMPAAAKEGCLEARKQFNQYKMR